MRNIEEIQQEMQTVGDQLKKLYEELREILGAAATDRKVKMQGDAYPESKQVVDFNDKERDVQGDIYPSYADVVEKAKAKLSKEDKKLLDEVEAAMHDVTKAKELIDAVGNTQVQ